MTSVSTEKDQQFASLIGRIFSDEKFAAQLESDPQQALTDAGIRLDAHQSAALKRPAAAVNPVALAADLASDPQRAVSAIVKPVVSVLTKGTKPAVNVVVSSAVVATAPQADDR